MQCRHAGAIIKLAVLAAVALGLAPMPVNAQEVVTLQISIKNHRFSPSRLLKKSILRADFF
jgi:hypothetical protein